MIRSLGLPVLALALLSCAVRQPPTVEDPFFRLRLLPGTEVPAFGAPEAAGPNAVGQLGYRIRVRIESGSDGEVVSAPSLTVFPGQRASVSILEEVSYVQDFDVETSAAAWLADPVVGRIRSGLVVEVVARPVPGSDRIALAWAFQQRGIEFPLRETTVTLSEGAEPVTIELPSTPLTLAVGRTLVTPGEETLLAETPLALGDASGATAVTARVDPVRLEGGREDADLVGPELVGFTEPTSLLDFEEGLPPPRGGGHLEISVVELAAEPPEPILHLGPHSAERLLARLGPRPLKTFRIRSTPERGARVACLLEKAYLKDYRVVAGAGPLDPIIGTVEAGFFAAVEVVKGEPSLEWRLATLFFLPDFFTQVDGLLVAVEIPLDETFSGTLPIRSGVNLATIAERQDGGPIALLVRRCAE